MIKGEWENDMVGLFKCTLPGEKKQAAKEENGGNNLFNKRQAKYVTVQVMEDKNHPELEGKFMIWKMPVNGVWNGKCGLAITAYEYTSGDIWGF